MSSLRLMRLYPDYVSFDRRQYEVRVEEDRRKKNYDRRKDKRAVVSAKLRDELSIFKVLAGYLFSNQH